MNSTELDAIFSVLASHYGPEPMYAKPRGKSDRPKPEKEKDFFKQKFDLTDEDLKQIRSEIDKDMNLNEKFDKLEEMLELLGFERANYHRDKGLSEFREDGDYGLKL